MPPSQTQPGAAVRLNAVAKSFRTRDRRIMALREVTASAPKGKVTGLVGPDAAGKTTLIRLCCGLLAPDAGEVEVLGMNARSRTSDIQAAVGYMPQRFGLYEDLTVQENLDFHADLQGLPPSQRGQRYDRLMEMTNLAPFTDRLAGALSGGMKQKLGLACALVKPREMLFLDEPTVGVDPLSRRELWDIVYQLVEEQGTSVLLSTSYLDEAQRCQEVVLLHRGRVLQQGPPGDFLDDMRGRCFLVRAEGGRRALQRRLVGAGGISDAVVRQDGVRVITGQPGGPALDKALSQEQGGPPPQEEVEPIFEDAFVAALLEEGSAEISQPSQPEEQTGRGEEGKAVIQVKDLVRRFGDFKAVDGLTFEVERGEVYGLLGANGAGKSTTFRMLCGLLPPSSGSLEVAGRDMRKAPASARASLGYMAQKFSLYGDLSVRENLDFFSRAYGLFGQRQADRLQWALEELELSQVAGDRAGELPLGYKQRLALAASLMHQPEVLFLDEPTSGVDPLARREFWMRINGLALSGVTVLITTHFMQEAEYCDRLLIMDQGKTLAQGSPAQVRSAQAQEGEPAPSFEEAFVALIQQHRREGAGEADA